MINFFAPSDSRDKETAARAQIFFRVVIGSAIITTGTLLFEMIVLPENHQRWIFIACIFDLVSLGLLFLNGKGKTRLASYVFAGILIVLIFGLAWTGGGIKAPAIQEIPIVVLAVGLMLGWKKSVLYAAGTVAASAGLVVAEYLGFLPASNIVPTSLSVLANSTMQIGLLLLLQYLIVANLDRALREAKEQVTRRSQAEESLQESEKRFRLILDNMPILLNAFDDTGVFIVWNKACEETTGYMADEILGNPRAMELLYPDPAYRAKVLNSSLDPRSKENVYDLVTKKGERRTIEWFDIYQRLEVPGWATWGMGQDITDRKRAEEALRFERLLLRTLIDNIPDSIYSKDMSCRKTLANTAEVRHLQVHSEADVVGKDDFEFYPKELAERFFADDQSVLQSGIALLDREEYVFNEKGEKRWLLTSKLPLRDKEGRTIGLVGIGRDITERKRGEEELRKLSLAIEQNPTSIVITDIHGKIEYVNPKFTQVTGYTMEEVRGKNPNILKSGETSNEEYRNLWETITAGNAWRGEFRNKKKNGEFFWEMASISPVKNQENVIINFVAVKEDITERKQVEEALRHAQKLESIGTLAGGIAHDFNNLLNAILGQSTLAMNKISNENPAKDHIEKSIRAAERAADLTRHLLAYSGKGKFVTEEMDLNRLVKENIQILEVSVPKTGQLMFELGVPSPHIQGDIGQIQQVIMNLIINAGEAIAPNPGFITVQTGRLTLTENDAEYWKYTNAPLKPGEYAMLRVTDTGHGIKPDVLLRIFDPFFTTKFTGRGLGLAAVLGIVRGHHGGLRIESKEGKGTTFEVVFPVLDAPAAAAEPEQRTATVIDGKGKTLLAIDDEPSILELLKDIFTEANFKVITASTPMEGIELYRKHRVGIAMVILDYSMPGMDGKAAFEELMKIDTGVKVLLCSGYSEEEMKSAFGDIRPGGFIKKPYKPTELLENVSSVLTGGTSET